MDVGDEMRASTLIPTVHSTLESFREFLPHLYASADGEEERAQAMVFIGNLQAMKESIEVLINRHLDDGDDEKLLLLLDLHDQVAATLNREDLKPFQVIEDLEMNSEDKLERGSIEIGVDGDHSSEGKRETPETFDDVFLDADRHWAVHEDFECPICIDEVPKEEGFAFECGHAYCRECLAMYLRTTIESGNVIDIVCPNPTCRIPVLVQDIIELVDNELFNKFQNFSLLQCLKADPSARWCPWPGCDEIMIIDEGVTVRHSVACTSCHRAICNMCFQPYHVESCAERKKNQEPEDKKTAKWKKRHGIKPCPHCGVATQKISGCPDMKCISCKKSWSWYHDEEQWNSSGLTRKDETMIEKAAFVYPRIVKQALGSREVAANQEKKEILLTVCLIGVAGVPATVISMPPALTVRAGRSVKRKLSRVSKMIKGEPAAKPMPLPAEE